MVWYKKYHFFPPLVAVQSYATSETDSKKREYPKSCVKKMCCWCQRLKENSNYFEMMNDDKLCQIPSLNWLTCWMLKQTDGLQVQENSVLLFPKRHQNWMIIILITDRKTGL